MRKCTMGWIAKSMIFLLCAVLLLPVACFGLYMTFLDIQASRDGWLMYLGGAFMFGSLAAFIIYRALYLGMSWVEYDEETMIFHISRKEIHRFRWEEIPGSKIQVERNGSGYLFCIRQNGGQTTIQLNRFFSGYKELEAVLEKTGVLRRMGFSTKEDMIQYAEQVFGQFQRSSDPDFRQPKPEGDCVVCPACQGRGILFKKFPFQKAGINIGKGCKICGGSGYLPNSSQYV